jgi:hypothetical protein
MDSAISQRLSEAKDVKGILRVLSRLEEVRSGTFRVASGETRGSFSFQNGYIVAADINSMDGHGKEAFQRLLSLREVAAEFVQHQAPVTDRRDELCIRVQDLIENHFSLDGIAWAPRAVAKVTTKTGQLSAFVKTGSEPALAKDEDTVSVAAESVIANIEQRRNDAQEITGPMPVQPEPAYDLSALNSIPTPGAAKLGSWGSPVPAPTAATPPTPQPTPSPAPQPVQPAAPVYDLSALEAIPTPGAKPATSSSPIASPTPSPMPSPTPMPTPASAVPASYDLSALEAIPTPGAKPSMASPTPMAEPTASPRPEPAPAGAYDLSALEAIPTPGAKPATPPASPQVGFMVRMAQSTEATATPAPGTTPTANPAIVASPPPAPVTPPPAVLQDASGGYDLSALEAIPTPQPKASAVADSAISQRLKVPTGESSNVMERLRTGMTADAPMPAYKPPTPPAAPAVPAPIAAPLMEAPAPTYAQIPDPGIADPPGSQMQRIASIIIVLTIALAAFTVPNMIKQSMKPANTEADMKKPQLKQVITDQLREQTPYAH